MVNYTEQWAKDYLSRARTFRRDPGADSHAGTESGPPPLLRADPYRNKWERDYAQLLGMRQHLGEIIASRYEGVTFRLADNTRLTPDFLVVTVTGFEIHEVKGFHREKWWARFKIAVEMFPWFRWFVCSRESGEGWTMKEVGRAG